MVKATSWAEIHLSNTDSTSRTKVHLCSAEQPLARRSQHLHFALSATRLHQLAFRGLRTSTSQVASLNQRSISRSEIDLASTDRQLPTGDQTSHLLHDNKKIETCFATKKIALLLCSILVDQPSLEGRIKPWSSFAVLGAVGLALTFPTFSRCLSSYVLPLR